ncbi:MAG TPA: proton-conducting transporter membrane subunit, partial [Thermoplasmata archaeon]|nr:proton-conducting transporter membrane subunit [Thermoplasmata archaeon]
MAVALSGVAMVLGTLIDVGEAASPSRVTNVQMTWLQLPATSGSGPFPNGFSLVMGTLVDPLSALMLIVVTVVGFVVMLYSIGYMHQDRGLARYYAELSLFLASMSALVLANNLLEFFLFWELVGLCSYFLIGFYYEKPSASSAAKEAFLVTRVGDVMFLLGVFILFKLYAASGPAGLGGWASNGFVFVHNGQPFLAGSQSNSTLAT